MEEAQPEFKASDYVISLPYPKEVCHKCQTCNHWHRLPEYMHAGYYGACDVQNGVLSIHWRDVGTVTVFVTADAYGCQRHTHFDEE